jgi:Flp pilus assembly protein TadD
MRRREGDFADNGDWQAEYAVTLVYADDTDEAIQRYRRSLRLGPDDPRRAVELAMLLLERREGEDLDEARRWAEHASTLAPDAPSVLACRAELLALRGDLAAAVALYDQAIRGLVPNGVQRRVFEQRARALGR